MSSPKSNLRGVAAMVLATGSFVINDSFMKLVTQGLPPLEVLFMRGVTATLWCLPLVLIMGHGPQLKLIFNRWILLRNACELFAVCGFVIALANMPIADITAIGQTAPLLLLLGTALIWRDRIGMLRMGLIILGFIGAVLVAQPGAAGFSVYAILGFCTALGSAARDLTSRRVSAETPAIVVAFSTLLSVMVGAGIGTTLFETWQMPTLQHWLLMIASGFFLLFGHLFIFITYRLASAATVAPFYYAFTIWAVIAGVLVFGDWPNPLAVAGMALILASGLTIAILDGRRRSRVVPTS